MVIGRYELRSVLARGGMATVHLGRLSGIAGFSRAVAIKRLHPHFVSDPAFVAMFADEARLAACIHNPHVVSVNDVVMHEGELLLVMDFVHGASLSTLLAAARDAGHVTDVGIVARILCDTLDGLHAAHEARDDRGQPLSIVHRDVSPQNILVDATGIARVIDFGVAKATIRFQSTREGQLKGKLCYMAPEQIRNQRVDRRVDVYAAAAVLWNALAGRQMYESDNEASLVYAILEGKRPGLRTVAPNVPVALQSVVEKGLCLDPNGRFATAAQMAEGIESTVKLASERDVARWIAETVPTELERQAALRFDVESRVLTLDATPAAAPQPEHPPASSVPSPGAFRLSSPTSGPPDGDNLYQPPATLSNASQSPIARERGSVNAAVTSDEPGSTSARNGSLRRAHVVAIVVGTVALSTIAAGIVAYRDPHDQDEQPSADSSAAASSATASSTEPQETSPAAFEAPVSSDASGGTIPSASVDAVPSATAPQPAAPAPTPAKKKRKYYGF